MPWKMQAVSQVKDQNTPPHLVCDVDNAAIFLLVVNSDVACQTCLAAWDLVGQTIKTSSSSFSVGMEDKHIIFLYFSFLTHIKQVAQ